MKSFLLACMLVLLPSLAFGQIEIKVEDRLQLQAQGNADVWIWNAPLPLVTEQRGATLFVDGPAGTYRVQVTGLTIDWENKSFTQDNGFVDITIGKQPEPDPDPDPNPDPDPDPSDAPFPAPGLTVMLIAEQTSIGMLPKDQRLQLATNGSLISWITNQTNGRYRFWDDDTKENPDELEAFNKAPKVFQDAFNAALKDMKEDEPWIIISNGETGTSQPLPQTEEETRKLIESFK